MNVTVLVDNEDLMVDVVVLSKRTTPLDISKIIESVKQRKQGFWTLSDILEKLPEDCKVYNRFKGELKSIIY